MKKLLIILLVLIMIILSSCDFVKERFLNGEPLYGGNYTKGTTYTPPPSPTNSMEPATN